MEARGRVQSDTGATAKKDSGRKCEKSQSLVNVRRRTINSGAKESIEEEEEESGEIQLVSYVRKTSIASSEASSAEEGNLATFL